MKTSTKLLIIFFSCIPLSLLAYNLLLKKEFTNKNFVREYYLDPSSTFVRKQLPTFKHIVIAGIDGSVNRDNITYWCPRISIDNIKNFKAANQRSGSYFNVIKQYQSNVNTKVKNDTLFISFNVKAGDSNSDLSELSNSANGLLQINADNIETVNAVSAYVTIGNNLSATGHIKLLIAGHGHYDVNNLNTDQLDITASDSSSFNIYQNNRIKNLSYSLLGKGALNLYEHPVQKFHPIQVDSMAIIQLNDKASNLQRRLN
jgi:hypothetical protein